MPVSRSPKLYGGTAYRNGEILDADSELEPDFAAIAGKFDANIVDADVNASAAIEPTKVADFSDVTEFNQTVQPPDSYNVPPVSAPDLTAELKFLRYAVKRLTVGLGGRFNDGSSNVILSWGEPAPVGGNLFRNSSFEFLDDSSEPIGWTAVGTGPPTFTLGATEASMGAGNELQMTAVDPDDGIQQVVKGIKAGTKYLIGISAKEVGADETLTIKTSGAVVGSAYEDIDLDETLQLTYQPYTVIVESDASGGDITVNFLSTAGTVDLDHAFMYELSEFRMTPSTLTAKTVTFATETTITNDAAQALVPVSDISSDLSIAVRPPAHNYYIRINVHLPWASNRSGFNSFDGAVVLLKDGVKLVQAPIWDTGAGNGGSGSHATIAYVDPDVDAGTEYTYSVSMIPDKTVNYLIAPNLASEMPASYQQQTAYLTVELVPIS